MGGKNRKGKKAKKGGNAAASVSAPLEQKSTQVLPERLKATFNQIYVHFERKMYKKGLKAIETILKANPNHADTIALKGLFLHSVAKRIAEGHKEKIKITKDELEPMELVQRALKLNPRSSMSWHVLGMLYRADFNHVQATGCFQSALRLEKSEDNSHKLQILEDMSALLLLQSRYSDYMTIRQQLLSAMPNRVQNWLCFAVSAHLSNKLPMALAILDSFQEIFQKAKDTAYERSEVTLYYNLILRESGAWGKALKHLYTNRKRVVDKTDMRATVAALHLASGRVDDALAHYARLLHRNCDNINYFLGVCLCLGVAGPLQEEVWARIAAVAPESESKEPCALLADSDRELVKKVYGSFKVASVPKTDFQTAEGMGAFDVVQFVPSSSSVAKLSPESASPVASGLLSANQVHSNAPGAQYLAQNWASMSTEKRGQLGALLKMLHVQYPRSLLFARLLLIALDAEDPLFKKLLNVHLAYYIRKGTPSLFVDLSKAIYSVPSKVAAVTAALNKWLPTLVAGSPIDIPIGTRTSDLLKDNDGESKSDGPERVSPSTFAFCAAFAAQHLMHFHRFSEAEYLLQAAVNHTPTFIRGFELLAELYDRSGAQVRSFQSYDQARQLDTQDRYLNVECTKRSLLCDRIFTAERTVMLFMREMEGLTYLEQVQTPWWSLRRAQAYLVRGDIPRAFRDFQLVQRLYERAYGETLVEFHLWSLRKKQVRSMVQTVRWFGQSASHFRWKSAVEGLLGCWLLVERQRGKKSAGEAVMNEPLLQVTPALPADEQKLRDGRLKEEMVLWREHEEKHAPLRSSDANRRYAQLYNEIAEWKDKYGMKSPADAEFNKFKAPPAGRVKTKGYVKSGEPLKEMLPLCEVLEKYQGNDPRTFELTSEVYWRAKRPLLLLRAVKRCVALAPGHPTAAELLVKMTAGLCAVLNEEKSSGFEEDMLKVLSGGVTYAVFNKELVGMVAHFCKDTHAKFSLVLGTAKDSSAHLKLLKSIVGPGVIKAVTASVWGKHAQRSLAHTLTAARLAHMDLPGVKAPKTPVEILLGWSVQESLSRAHQGCSGGQVAIDLPKCKRYQKPGEMSPALRSLLGAGEEEKGDLQPPSLVEVSAAGEADNTDTLPAQCGNGSAPLCDEVGTARECVSFLQQIGASSKDMESFSKLLTARYSFFTASNEDVQEAS